MRRGSPLFSLPFSLPTLGCALALVVASVLLVGCGPGTTTGGGPPGTCGTPTSGAASSGGGVGSGGTAVATPNGTVIVLPMTPGTPPNPAPGAPVPPYVTPGAAGATGKVSIAVSPTVATPCDTIRVLVANGLATPIFTANYQSECSIVTVQFQSGGAWQPIAPCTEGRPTMIVKIPAGAVAAITLGPTSGARFGGGLWRVGAYRVEFTYSATPRFGGGASVYSAPFQVSAVS